MCKVIENRSCFILWIILSSIGYCSLYSELYAQANEVFRWDLRVGFIKFGEGTGDISTNSDSLMTHMNFEAQSTGIFKTLYNAHYMFKSDVSSLDGLPIRSARVVKEKKYSNTNHVLFDHLSHPDSSVIISDLSGEKKVTKNCFDIISGMSYFRNQCVDSCRKMNQTMCIKTYFSDEEWDLKLKFKKQEIIHTIWGDQPCLAFEIRTEVGRFFKKNDDVTIWFTDDPLHIPVKVRIKFTLYAVDARLTEYYNNKIENM